MEDALKDVMRRLPAVDRLLRTAAARKLDARFGPALVTDALRRVIEGVRERLQAGGPASEVLPRHDEDYVALAAESLGRLVRGSLRRVVNATGVIVHTNLGRSPLSRETAAHVLDLATGYSNLEYDVEEGRRGHRESHVEGMAGRLLGCERCCVVNNNAGALVLLLNTLADGRETIVSRGELIEIGGSFRLPDIMRKSGTRLVEVGTTNKTRAEDYERAISGDTALILKVHPSNFRIVGFAASPRVEELAAIGRPRGIPVVEDQGSGNLVDLVPHGITGEATAREILEGGADLVLFSGDKLLGGPQAGIIAGRGDLVARCLANPLYRALRPDKMTLAGLEATLRSYLTGRAMTEVPVLRMISRSREELEARAGAFVERSGPLARVRLSVERGGSRVGGGAVPDRELESAVVAVLPGEGTAAELERFLRSHDPPVIARIEEGRVLIDLRTVREDEEEQIMGALRAFDHAGP